MTLEQKVQKWCKEAKKHKTGEFTETLDLSSFASLARAELEQKIDQLQIELNVFQQAVAHVTEAGKTRRSFSTPGSWAMVHADRLTDLEIAEERCAARSSVMK